MIDKWNDCGYSTCIFNIHRWSSPEFCHTGRAKNHHSDLGGIRTRDLSNICGEILLNANDFWGRWHLIFTFFMFKWFCERELNLRFVQRDLASTNVAMTPARSYSVKSNPSVMCILSQDEEHEDHCAVCQQSGEVLMCETCVLVYHLKCLTPPLTRIPPGMWMCPKCQVNQQTYSRLYHLLLVARIVLKLVLLCGFLPFAWFTCNPLEKSCCT